VRIAKYRYINPITRTTVKARPGKYFVSDVTVGAGVVPWSALQTKKWSSMNVVADMANLWN
jgi:hypothetical protein